MHFTYLGAPYTIEQENKKKIKEIRENGETNF